MQLARTGLIHASSRLTLVTRSVIQSGLHVSHLSLRLPEDVEQRLLKEAELAGRNRSDLVREALAEYLTRKDRERLIKEMKRAASVAYSNPEVAEEARQIQQEFDDVDDGLKWIEAEERAAGIDPDDQWWE